MLLGFVFQNRSLYIYIYKQVIRLRRIRGRIKRIWSGSIWYILAPPALKVIPMDFIYISINSYVYFSIWPDQKNFLTQPSTINQSFGLWANLSTKQKNEGKAMYEDKMCNCVILAFHCYCKLTGYIPWFSLRRKPYFRICGCIVLRATK